MSNQPDLSNVLAGFETFTGGKSSAPRFSFNSKATHMVLSSGFLTKVGEGATDHVELLYSKDKNAMILKFTDETNPNGIKIGKTGGKSIAISAFKTQNGIQDLESKKYEPSEIETPEGNVYMVDFSKSAE